MAQRTIAGLGLTGFWDLGTDSWKTGTDQNYRLLSLLVQSRVISKDTVLPASPNEGDMYLVKFDAASDANKIAAYDDGDWYYVDPIQGFSVYVTDLNKHYYYDGTNWVEHVSQGQPGTPGVGTPGTNGTDGDGWTGGSYDASTGKVSFTSDDGLEFETGDLRGTGGGGSGSTNVKTLTVYPNTATNSSSSGFASKGNTYLASKDLTVTAITFNASSTGTYEVVAAIFDNTSSNADIVSLTKTTVSAFTAGPNENNLVVLDTPFDVASGEYLHITFVKTDGTGSSSSGAYFGQSYTFSNDDITFQGSHRIADNDLQVGDGPNSDFLVGDVWSVGFTYDVVSSETLIDVQNETDDYTLTVDANNQHIRVNKGTAVNLTVPDEATVSLEIGTTVSIRQSGAGQLTVVAGTGVTINSAETLKLRAQHSAATLIKVASDEWDLAGDLEVIV